MSVYPALDLTYVQDEHTPALLELVHACLDDFGPVAIYEHDSGDGWRVFFRTPESRDGASHALHERLSDRILSISSIGVPDEGWARRSQAQLTAVKVGRFVIAPPWAIPAGERDDLVVVIEPSMGFGTGHHATTRLCLQLLQEEAILGRHVIDIGTGSGVLALASWKLGAQGVVAVDCDPDALQNARENIARNGADGAIDTVEADLGALHVDPADIVLANLTSAVLQSYAGPLRRLVRGHGHLIVSGFGPDELMQIERAFERMAAQVVTDDAWAAARFDFPPKEI